MFIYISGPYSPASKTLDPIKQALEIEANIERANTIALAVLKKGHVPFVPHTMMRGWEDQYGVSREIVLQNCYQWVERCDALFFIASSQGALAELEIAQNLGLTIYMKIEEMPENFSGYID